MKFNSEKPQKTNKKTAEKKQTGLTTGKKALIIVMCVVAALFAAAAAGVVYVSTIEDVFPNVYVDGVDVSGMSQTEAMAALDGSFVNVYEGQSRKIEMTTNFMLEIASEDALKLPTILDAVNDAWNVGRDGNPITNALQYIKSLSDKTEFEYTEKYEIDEVALRAIVDNVAVEIQLALIESTLFSFEDFEEYDED